MILTFYFLLSLFCFVKVFFWHKTRTCGFSQIEFIVFRVLCSTLCPLKMSCLTCLHVGMLACWSLFWNACVTWSACWLFLASRSRMLFWLKSFFICLLQPSVLPVLKALRYHGRHNNRAETQSMKPSWHDTGWRDSIEESDINRAHFRETPSRKNCCSKDSESSTHRWSGTKQELKCSQKTL